VLGNKLIHLKYLVNKQWNEPTRTLWVHSVCPFGNREDEDYECWKAARVPVDRRSSLDQDQCAKECRPRIFQIEKAFLEARKSQRSRVPVDVLRSCRQIYIEANPILWQTNTFAVDDVYTFRTFAKDMTNTQRQLLTNLRFDIPFYIPWLNNAYPQIRGIGMPGMRDMKKLKGVRVLHIRLSLLRRSGVDMPRQDLVLNELYPGLLNMQALALEKVTVTLTGCYPRWIQRVSCADELDFVEWVQSRLLHKNGPGTDGREASQA